MDSPAANAYPSRIASGPVLRPAQRRRPTPAAPADPAIFATRSDAAQPGAPAGMAGSAQTCPGRLRPAT